MKKLLQTLCSLFCVMSMSLPVEALARIDEHPDDAREETQAVDPLPDDYRLVFVKGDFGLTAAASQAVVQADGLVMFLRGPDGRLVKDAQVITTLIDGQGAQQMSRARSYLGGYRVGFAGLPPGAYRVETEVVTGGQLLTDEFYCEKV